MSGGEPGPPGPHAMKAPKHMGGYGWNVADHKWIAGVGHQRRPKALHRHQFGRSIANDSPRHRPVGGNRELTAANINDREDVAMTGGSLECQGIE
jgi:hypothetical protein